MDASNWSASMQLLYVKLAAKRGNWRDLDRHGLDPTEMMKRLYISMRAKYIQWKRRRDVEDELEAAIPKQWFEIEPGHWVWAKSEEAARVFANEFASVPTAEQLHAHREYPYIDTSRTCPRCGNPTLGSGIEKCAMCWTPNTKWPE